MNEQNKPAEPILRWVKATEKIPQLPDPLPLDTPEERGILFINRQHSCTHIWFPSYGYSVESAFEIYKDKNLYDEGFELEKWEWLEEIPGPDPSPIKEGEEKAYSIHDPFRVSADGFILTPEHPYFGKSVHIWWNEMSSSPAFDPKEEQQPEGEDEKWKGHDRESLLWHLAIRDVNIEKMEAEIQTLRNEFEGAMQANRNIVDQNCSLLDERDRGNASFKKMYDLFGLKIQEAKDYRKALQNFVDKVERGEARSKRSYAEMKGLLDKYPSTPPSNNKEI